MHLTLEPTLKQGAWTMRRSPVLALVWAADDQRASEAVDHVHSDVWAGRYLYELAEVRQVPQGVPCPLRRDDPAVLEYELRHGWMWVLVRPGTGPDGEAPDRVPPPCPRSSPHTEGGAS